MSGAAGSVRARLAAATAEAHTRLERALDLERVLVDTGALVATLARMRGFFAGLEPTLHALLLAATMAGRSRLADLDADLRALGLGDAGIAALPVARPPALGSADAALGALYVVEGARLGGRLIARQLAAAAIAPATALRFWSDDGAHVQERWRSFLAILDAAAPSAALEAGANATFAALGDWFAASGARLRDAPETPRHALAWSPPGR